jgi:hypothetical protein
MTKSQLQIIDSIKLEFEKINNTKSYGCNLIDIDGILGDIAKDKITREEVRINNEYKISIIDDMIDADIDLLNEDLLQIGLIATKESNHRIIISIHGKFTSETITLNYKLDCGYTRLIGNESLLTYIGFGGISSYIDSPNYKKQFKNLQSVASSDAFKLRIRNLYEKSLNTKN